MTKRFDTVKATAVLEALALVVAGVIAVTALVAPRDKNAEKDGHHTIEAPVETRSSTEQVLVDETTQIGRAIFMTDDGEAIREIKVVMVYKHSDGGYVLMDVEGNLTKTDVSERVQIITPSGFVIN